MARFVSKFALELDSRFRGNDNLYMIYKNERHLLKLLCKINPIQ